MSKNSHTTHITGFLKKHHVATLATVDSSLGAAWCSNLFYAFDEQEMELIFTSGETTRHVRDFTENRVVAASVVLESKIVGKLQGIQITGTIRKADSEHYKEIYLKRFPYSVFMLKELWVLRIETAKYTDNRLGFGKKLFYERPDIGR